MTPEEVIDLAAQHHVASESPLFNQQLVAFAAAIEAAMIERCAKVCDERAKHRRDTGMEFGARLCADAIRALAKKEGS